MAKTSSEQTGIQLIYASNFLHTSLWSFVTGQKLCGKEVNESIKTFMSYFNLEDIEFGSLKQAYYRKNAEFMKCAKGISTDAKVVFDAEVHREVDRVLALMGKQ
jgi:hypothetical protein